MKAALAIAAALVAGCRSNPNYCEGSPDNSCASVDGAVRDDAPADDAPAGSGSGSDGPVNTYRPTAVAFALSYLTQGSLTDVANSAKGTFSVWIKFDASDGTDQDIILEQYAWGIGGVTRTSANKIRFWLHDCDGSTAIDMETANPVTAGSGWTHVLAAWDAALGKAKLYVNDNLDVANVSTDPNHKVCYSPPTPPHTWGVGGLSSNALVADVADMYAALGTYQDIDSMAVRRAFIDARGKPVDLGAQCQLPAGAPATLCLRGDAATWNTNRGVGGGFTLNGGALSLSTSNPAD